MKIASFEKNIYPFRSELWRQQCQIELDYLDPDQLTLNWPELAKKFSAFFLEESQTEAVFKQFHNLPTDVVLSKSVDCLIFQINQWWPRNFWIEALKGAIIASAGDLENRSQAYVTGSGNRARSAIYVLIQLGFAKINWVVESQNSIEESYQQLKKKFFGVQIQVLEDHKLTLQPSNGSVLINTVEQIANMELIKDLSYLNFLHKQSLVVDTNIFPSELLLLNEARNVGIRTLSGDLIEGFRDYLLLQMLLGPKLQIERPKYLEKWQEILKTRPTSS